MTEQRRIIQRILRQSDEHMTAEQIYRLAKECLPTIAIATVYRNLGLMIRDGEIRRISVKDGPDHFDRTVTPHDHLVCQGCGTLVDIEIPSLQDALERQTGQRLTGYTLTLYYLCPECVDKKI